MLRLLTSQLSWFACIALSVSAVAAQDGGLGETLLPDTTKGFISVTDVDDLTEHWQQTQMGQLMADPVMEPFAEDFQRQMQSRFSDFQKKLGLTLDDLIDVPSGELTIGVVRTDEGHRALVVLMQVKDHIEEGKAMLETAKANLKKDGAKPSEDTISGTPVTILELPKDALAEEDDPAPRSVYFMREDLSLLGAADNVDVMKGVLARLSGEKLPDLAGLEAFQYVMKRCVDDAGDWTPQVRWFVDPIGYLDLIEREAPPSAQRKGRSMLAVLKNQGFDAIKGGGGFVDLGVEDYQLMHRSAVMAPPPYEKAMKMMVFPNSDEFAPQPWVPREIATYMTFYVDVLNAFDNFNSLFDELFGEGETGVWLDVLDSLENDPNGPKINLRDELFVHLDNRVTAITDYELPITTASERLLFSVLTKDPKKVSAAIAKTLKNDKEIKRREYKGHVVWETVPLEKPDIPTISLALPPLGGIDDVGPGMPQLMPQDSEPLLPNAAVTVAHGDLMVASHYDFLIKVLDEIDERETLAHDVEFRVIEKIMTDKLGAADTSLRTFSRMDEEYRPTYELIRQGKMPESETMLGRVLNSIFGVDEDGDLRKQEIDGSKLPDYDFVRRHLGPAGMFGVSEPEGWFVKGVMLGRESP